MCIIDRNPSDRDPWELTKPFLESDSGNWKSFLLVPVQMLAVCAKTLFLFLNNCNLRLLLYRDYLTPPSVLCLINMLSCGVGSAPSN